ASLVRREVERNIASVAGGAVPACPVSRALKRRGPYHTTKSGRRHGCDADHSSRRLNASRIRAPRVGAGGCMTSILETPETRPSTPGSGPGRILAVGGIAVAIVMLGLTAYLLVALRDARRQIAHLTERTTIADQRAKELDLALAALGGQTVSIDERGRVRE